MKEIYELLYKEYGRQRWWPVSVRNWKFEVMVGAILTQNTNWANVEKAIKNLKNLSLLHHDDLLETNPEIIKTAIKSAGYFNQKAERLKLIARWYKNNIKNVNSRETQKLRTELLSLSGVGQETADSILLYAFGRPIFVVDAYARRIFSRLGYLSEDASYEEWQELFMSELERDSNMFNEYHALIVEHAKHHCKKNPKCDGCVLSRMCKYK